ncbi:unnamed protein product, partial [Brugia timori]|uniref:DUF218 domain-containing protein n=1 Tax=Brugia timori TaxID=42155 RepID=A0A0R3RAK8_9BILA
SGAQATCISKKLAERLHLEDIDYEQATFAGFGNRNPQTSLFAKVRITYRLLISVDQDNASDISTLLPLTKEISSWKQPKLIIGVNYFFKEIPNYKFRVFFNQHTVVAPMIARSGYINKHNNHQRSNHLNEIVTQSTCCSVQNKDHQTTITPINIDIPEIDRFWKLEFIGTTESIR